jgi:hypothetical protein
MFAQPSKTISIVQFADSLLDFGGQKLLLSHEAARSYVSEVLLPELQKTPDTCVEFDASRF